MLPGGYTNGHFLCTGKWCRIRMLHRNEHSNKKTTLLQKSVVLRCVLYEQCSRRVTGSRWCASGLCLGSDYHLEVNANWMQNDQLNHTNHWTILNEKAGEWQAEFVITRMHSSRMRTARFSGRLSCTHAPPNSLPCMPPLLSCTPFTTHAPLAMHSPLPHTHPSFATHALPPNRITDRCKNVTFL